VLEQKEGTLDLQRTNHVHQGPCTPRLAGGVELWSLHSDVHYHRERAARSHPRASRTSNCAYSPRREPLMPQRVQSASP